MRSRRDHGARSSRPQPYEPVFTAGSARRKELDELLTRYPTKMAALLPALWMVQHERGWVSDDGMAEVAEVLELTPAYVKGVVTFYTMYHQHPVGEALHSGLHDVAVQRRAAPRRWSTRSCAHTGCQELGQTSPDGKFTVIEVECLGACGFATPIMINEDFIESVTPETRARQILAGSL